MSKLIQSADAIRNLARLFKNMEEAADQLESIGSLDQARAEKEKALAALDAQLTVARNELNTQHNGLKATEEHAAEIVAKAKADAASLIAAAEEKIAQSSKAAADHMVADYVAHEGMLSAAEDAQQERVKASEAKVVAMRDESNKLINRIADQNAELTRLTDAIEAARAAMAQIMGK